jgi:hypothetical protein
MSTSTEFGDGEQETTIITVPTIKADFLEAGSSGPVVMLVHSSVSGARQWRRLMDDLQGQFRVRAVIRASGRIC